MSLQAEGMSKSSDTQENQPSSFQRTVTEKFQEICSENAGGENAFNRAYDSWKQTARESWDNFKKFVLSIFIMIKLN